MSAVTIPDNQEELLARYLAKQAGEEKESVERYRKITKAAVAKWIDNFKAGGVEIKTVRDLRELVELDMLLQQK